MPRKILMMALASAGGFLLLITILLIALQQHMIYFPRLYEPGLLRSLEREGIVRLTFETTQGKQVAYYVGPEGAAPRMLWLYTGGNGSLALDWMEQVTRHPEATDGHLLIDYPGYGECEGAPSPRAIDRSVDGALAALALHLKVSPAQLTRRTGMIGHSLGAAIALRTAGRLGAERVVLISPFTSMLDMARLSVGAPLCHLLHHRWDNVAELGALARLPRPPAVIIFHGENDSIIPVEMARTLASNHPEFVFLHEILAGDHNGILTSQMRQFVEAMTRGEGGDLTAPSTGQRSQ